MRRAWLRAPTLVGAAVLFALVLALTLWLVWPRGSKIGETAVYPSSGAPVNVELSPGDTLVFRLDVKVALAGPDDRDEDVARGALMRSVLTVHAVKAGAPELVASCPSDGSRALLVSSGGGTLSLTGVLVECSITAAEGGFYAVTGAIVPAADLEMKRAELEVRRERKR